MKKKILILTELTVPYSSGSGINAFNFAKALVGKGSKVKILTFNWGKKHQLKEVREGVLIKRIPFSFNKYLNRVLTLFVFIPYFKYQLFSHKIVLIYGRFPGLVLIILLGWLLKKKIIFQSTALGHDDFYSLLHHKWNFKKWVFKKLFAYYSLSPAFTDIFYNNIPSSEIKLFQSPQGVNTSIYFTEKDERKLQLKKKLQLPTNKSIIVTVANLIKRKGFEDIFKVLNKINNDFIYLIIGNTETNKSFYFWQDKREMEYLAKLGKELLKDKIQFAGRKNNVDEYLKTADILILNSEKEGLPNAILEAMACGVTPVIKNIEGLKGYVVFPEKNAVVFDTKKEMKIAIEKTLTNKTIREKLGAEAAVFIQKNCSMKQVAKNFLDFINENE